MQKRKPHPNRKLTTEILEALADERAEYGLSLSQMARLVERRWGIVVNRQTIYKHMGGMY